MEALPGLDQVAQAFQHRPQPSGILIACALICTVIAIIFMLLRLAPVLVPLTFAVFLAFLVEPILSAIVFAPQAIGRLCCGRRPRGSCVERPGPHAGRPPAHLEVGEDSGRGGGASGSRPSGFASRSGGRGLALEVEAEAAATDDAESSSFGGLESDRDPEALVQGPPGGAYVDFLGRLQMMWDVISILLCVIALLAILAGIVLGFYASMNSFDWRRYTSSPKLQDVKHLLQGMGVNETDWGDAVKHYQHEVTSVASSLVGVAGNVVITMLLFFFCLVAILPGIRQQLPKSRMRSMMQKYLLCKTVTSLIIAAAVMLCLWIMDVPLVLIFGMITFFANFIPNVGSFISIIAPAPFVYLTPGKDIHDVILVIVVPFVIHNSLGCTLEPQLMQAGLDLHPLTVVVALTFWGAVWGIAGMVLSVPITCAIRIWLGEVDHPHARLLHDVLDKPLGVRRRTKLPSPAVSPAASVRDSSE